MNVFFEFCQIGFVSCPIKHLIFILFYLLFFISFPKKLPFILKYKYFCLKNNNRNRSDDYEMIKILKRQKICIKVKFISAIT